MNARPSKLTFLAVLCGIIPLLALAAIMFLNTPSLPTVVVSMLVLTPIASQLVSASWQPPSRR